MRRSAQTFSAGWLRTPCICLAVLFLWGSRPVFASDCQTPSDEMLARIEVYLSKRHIDPNNLDARPKVRSVVVVPNSCFWKLEVAVPDVKQPVTMYLSPDERFLTSAIYDLSIDPALEVARISKTVNDFLLRDASPTIAGRQSHIDLVEFSDLECPSCRRFSEWFDSLPADLKNQTTLRYKHFPLAQHPWARMASNYAACASTVSPTAFWLVVHRLFEMQDKITLESLRAEVINALGSNDESDVKALTACIDSDRGAAIVDRDIAAANQLAVSSTPTVFINGRRVTHIQSEKALEDLLRGTVNQKQQSDEITTK